MPARLRILVLGSSGQIGRAAASALAGAHDVVAGQRSAAARGADWPMVQVDLLDHDALRRTVAEVGPQLVVNAAALTDVEAAEREPAPVWAVNAVAPGVLAEACRASGAALVHLSTDYVFDGSGTRPWTEDDRPAPLCEYGAAKWAGEQAIAAAGAKALVLRTSWVYAPGGRHFVGRVLDRAAAARRLEVVADQIGAPTPAAVVAEVIRAVADRLAAGQPVPLAAPAARLHLACGGETSRHAFAAEIVRRATAAGVLSHAVEVVPIATPSGPDLPRRPLNSRLDCRRLEAALGLALPAWDAAFAAAWPGVLAAWRSQTGR